MTAPLLVTYRTLGLGDLLTALPALRAISRAFPGHDRVLTVPDWVAPLADVAGTGHRIVALAELAPLPDDLHAPAVAVNLHGAGPQSHRRLLAARPGRLVAFRHPQVRETAGAVAWREDEHEVLRWCRMLEAADIPTDPQDLHFPVPGAAAAAADDVAASVAGATVVHPGAGSRARRWPVERFAAVAAAERDDGRPVVVTGSQAEAPLAEEVVRLAGLPPAAQLAGRTDLVGLARVIGRASRVVAGDTGVGHLATALGTPSVLLFGPTPPRQWGPPAHLRHRHRVLWAGDVGNPHGDEVVGGLLELSVDDVRAALATLQVPSKRAS